MLILALAQRAIDEPSGASAQIVRAPKPGSSLCVAFATPGHKIMLAASLGETIFTLPTLDGGQTFFWGIK